MLVVPFGPRRILGVVVEVAEASDLPPERLAEPVSALEADVPPDLVRLGLWVAEEYVSTPARGLALVLPPGTGTGRGAAHRRQALPRCRAHRCRARGARGGGAALRTASARALEALADGPAAGERALARPPAAITRAPAVWSGAGCSTLQRTIEPPRRPELRSVGALPRVEHPTPAQQAALAQVVGAMDAGHGSRGSPAAPARCHGLGQDRGLPARRAGGARARAHRDRAGARDRPHAPDGRALRAPLRRHRGDPALTAVGARALRRVVAPALGRREGVRRAPLGRVRPAERRRPDRDRRGARQLLQAGGRPPLRRPPGGRAPRGRLRRRAARR